MSKLTFNAGSPELQALNAWWSGLKESPGIRAELRRCANLEEAALASGTQDLCRKLHARFEDLDRLGAIAALASHLKALESRPLAAAFAGKGDAPALSDLRFRRLIQCQEAADLFPLLRRALGLLDKTANLEDLARSLWHWNDRTRKRWTFTYYQQPDAESLD